MRPLASSKIEYAAGSHDGRHVSFPGFLDVHVHSREPGFSYKETIRTAALAAARGGFTGFCAMPNLDPVPDTLEHLKAETDIIERDACIPVYPYASITRGEKGEVLSDMRALNPLVIGFSDDGHGVKNEELMREAMETAADIGALIVAHCEVAELSRGGYVHDGVYAATHGHRGISSESEWREVERDIRLADDTGAAFHVCHVSTKESVSLIRDAIKSRVDISAETAPHYLLLSEDDLEEYGRFKMNPPVRSGADRDALIEGVLDGTISIIATDHAPHSAEEKSLGLEKSAFGIVGLETAFPVLYTGLVRKGILSLERLIELLSFNPRARFKIPLREDEYSVWDLERSYRINPREFLSLGRATPFEGMTVYGRCLKTVSRGKTVFSEEM